jgi:hypothetical protein
VQDDIERDYGFPDEYLEDVVNISNISESWEKTYYGFGLPKIIVSIAFGIIHACTFFTYQEITTSPFWMAVPMLVSWVKVGKSIHNSRGADIARFGLETITQRNL